MGDPKAPGRSAPSRDDGFIATQMDPFYPPTQEWPQSKATSRWTFAADTTDLMKMEAVWSWRQ